MRLYLNGQISFFEKIIFLLIIPFFIWSFLGAHRQPVFGIVSDYLSIALVLSAVCIVFFFSLRMKYSNSLLLFTIYLFICLNSFFFSKEDELYLYSLLPTIAYFFIAVGCALYFEGKSRMFFGLIVFSTVLSGLVVIFSFLLLGMSSWGRITIPFYVGGEFRYFSDNYSEFTDPNVLAFFLGFGFFTIIFYIHKLSFKIVAASIVFLAIFLTMSRSAFLAVFLVSFFLSIINFRVFLKKKVLIFVLIFILFLISSIFLFDFSYFLDLIQERINSSFSNSDRIHRLSIVLGYIFKDISSVLIGYGPGYSASTMDPHNFYLSTIMDTGIFSLFILISILFYLLFKIYLSHDRVLFLYAFSLVSFFILISMFYWQLRTYYFLIMILFVLKDISQGKSLNVFRG